MADEFQEIAHSGGKITFSIKTENGRRLYSIGWTHARPGPCVVMAIYALPPGIPVASIRMGGIGQPWSSPPMPGCFPVLIASDSRGQFGHECPACGQYWRGPSWAQVCPYCMHHDEAFRFLSEAQLRYVRHYIEVLTAGLESDEDKDVVIDMDEVADAAGHDGPKPDFYVAERDQQYKFNCDACGSFNDVLGRYRYCCVCGTRNDLREFELQVSDMRDRLNAGDTPEKTLRDAVSAFDSFVAQLAKQLVDLVPMTPRRRQELAGRRYHDIEDVCSRLGWFDIRPRGNMSDNEFSAVVRLFQRRHVHEHHGGEVDERYLETTGDKTVQLGQLLRESKGEVHHFLNCLVKMARSIHGDFHMIFEPCPEPIKAHQQRQERIKRAERDR